MQMCQNQAIHCLKGIDDIDPTTVNIGTATQLWGGCEILCNLQQYKKKYRQQYKLAQGGWYVVQPLGSAEIGLSGGGYGAIHCSIYVSSIENLQQTKKMFPVLYPV